MTIETNNEQVLCKLLDCTNGDCEEVTSYLLATGVAKDSPVLWEKIAKTDNLDVAKILIDDEFDVNTFNLETLCNNGAINCINYIIDNKANELDELTINQCLTNITAINSNIDELQRSVTIASEEAQNARVNLRTVKIRLNQAEQKNSNVKKIEKKLKELVKDSE